MREERSEQSGENIPLLYFVFLGQRMQTRVPVSVSHLFSTRNIDERIGSEADRELTVCSSHFAMVTPERPTACLRKLQAKLHTKSCFHLVVIGPYLIEGIGSHEHTSNVIHLVMICAKDG